MEYGFPDSIELHTYSMKFNFARVIIHSKILSQISATYIVKKLCYHY